jgi:hypothetical protein
MYQPEMRRFYLSVFFGFVISTGIVLCIGRVPGFCLVDVYQTKLQVPIFAGCLTIGSFLLTLKTLILLRLKEGLYDRPEYERIFRNQLALDEKLVYYGPLSRLGDALILSVFLAMTCAVCQLSLGFVRSIYTVSACLGLAISTIGLVLFCWCQIRQNLKRWFEVINAEKTQTAHSVPQP